MAAGRRRGRDAERGVGIGGVKRGGRGLERGGGGAEDACSGGFER